MTGHEYYEGATRLGGQLTGSGGAISGGQFASTIGGTLTNPDHAITVSGRVDGEFRGQNGDLVAGSLTANASGPGYTYRYDGGFSGSEAGQ